MAVNGEGRLGVTHLCHALKREGVGLGVAATSLVAFPVGIRRPEPGSAAGCAERTVVCGFCGAEMVLLVYDANRTRARRHRWLALGVLGGLVAALGILGLACPVGDIAAGSALLAGLVAVIGAGAVVGIGSLRLWLDEDGVRFPARGQPGHSVRRFR